MPDGIVGSRIDFVRTAGGLVRAVRPRQWAKNVLVLAAPAAAHAVDSLAVLGGALIAFIAFSMAASSIYLVNDSMDVAADRAHPTKCKRPIAAGIVPVPLALSTAGLLLVGSLYVSTFAS